ncbi:MAG: PQQ-binding-like beta-propeller repeat protein, partial [Planctomycetia bacterium]
MRENRAMGLPIYARGLAILLSLGFILTSAQAKPPIRPPVLTKEAQRDLLKRAAAQKAAQKRIEARVAKEKEAAAKKAAEKKKELQKNGKPQKVMVQQQIQIQGNLVIRNGVPDKEEDSGGSTAILPQPDRETLQRLKDAKILIEKERFGEAVRILGDILSSSDDSFFPMEDDSEEGDRKIRGLRDEAEKILGGLPPQAMELYELQFGAQAKQFLKEAMQAGNTRAPADISRRFFYTEAGIEATWLAGLASMDEGRWKAAVLAFDRFKKVPHVASRYEPLLSILKSLCMEQAGQSKLAEKAWQGLRERSPRATIQIVGKSVPLFANQGETFQQFLKRANLDQLNVSSSLRALAANQMLPFGTPDRNASIDASLPLLKRTWRVRGTEQPMAEAILKKQRETCIDNGTLAVPRFYPLVVDGVLFARTLDVIVAIDIETGKRIWDAQADDPNEKRIAGSSSNASRVSSQLQSQLSQIWGNSIFGHLTSDTRNLYAIESDSMPKDAYQMRRMGVNSGGLSNILVAIDLENGEERWRRSTGIEDEPLFFLGPPLPLDGVLYSLAESRGEIQLVVLSASTGEVEWVQRIAISEQVAWPYSAQYYHAQMPAVLDGVMVCPTGTGAVVAIEPTTRSLLWAYCYERLGRRQHRMIMVNGMPRSANQDRIGEELVLHDNYVFSAPVDSNYLHCLDLRTGKEIWKQAFTDGAFIGGVYKDRLLVVGRNKFQTLNVKNGQKVGECFLDESLGDSGSVLVTGCGFRNEGIYYIAESSGDIVALDIERCKVVHRIHSREPMVLGNLVAADDRIFSQSLEGIEAFHQLKAIREKIEEQLKKDPNNLEAMGMQGDLLLAEGKVEEAVEKFRHIYKVAKTPANEERLLEAFCVALKDMYPKYRHMRPEIEVLLRTDQQKADYWYCVTIGETAENNLAAAADACIELANLSSQTRLTISTDRYHEVQRERFVQAQLGTIYAMADEDLQKKLAD